MPLLFPVRVFVSILNNISILEGPSRKRTLTGDSQRCRQGLSKLPGIIQYLGGNNVRESVLLLNLKEWEEGDFPERKDRNSDGESPLMRAVTFERGIQPAKNSPTGRERR